jgi:hypothetical protein
VTLVHREGLHRYSRGNICSAQIRKGLLPMGKQLQLKWDFSSLAFVQIQINFHRALESKNCHDNFYVFALRFQLIALLFLSANTSFFQLFQLAHGRKKTFEKVEFVSRADGSLSHKLNKRRRENEKASTELSLVNDVVSASS